LYDFQKPEAATSISEYIDHINDVAREVTSRLA
jgi:hypothetical protein